jgi:hypothetical protein
LIDFFSSGFLIGIFPDMFEQSWRELERFFMHRLSYDSHFFQGMG